MPWQPIDVFYYKDLQSMCDQDHFEDDLKKYSRRDLGALAAFGIGASILFCFASLESGIPSD
jgi:hypothetical protein